jgi:hypothetical protein
METGHAGQDGGDRTRSKEKSIRMETDEDKKVYNKLS